MKHLTVDQIIEFVSLTELNGEAIKLSAAVNGHIRRCGKCLELVRAVQSIYDEFSKLHAGVDFKRYLSEAVLSEDAEHTVNIQDTLEGFR